VEGPNSTLNKYIYSCISSKSKDRYTKKAKKEITKTNKKIELYCKELNIPNTFSITKRILDFCIKYVEELSRLRRVCSNRP
jgi:hypothetical protein